MTRQRVDRPDRNGRYRNPYAREYDPNAGQLIYQAGTMPPLGGRADLAGVLGFEPGQTDRHETPEAFLAAVFRKVAEDARQWGDRGPETGHFLESLAGTVLDEIRKRGDDQPEKIPTDPALRA